MLIDELIRKEKVELRFHREGMIIGKGASSTDILRWDLRKVLYAEPLRKRAQKPRILTAQRRVGREGPARLSEPTGRE